MAILSESAKKKVPKSERGIPSKSGTGSYPMPDKAHERAALGLAAMHHGKNSSTYRQVRAKAKKLGYIKSGDKRLSDLR